MENLLPHSFVIEYIVSYNDSDGNFIFCMPTQDYNKARSDFEELIKEHPETILAVDLVAIDEEDIEIVAICEINSKFERDRGT